MKDPGGLFMKAYSLDLCEHATADGRYQDALQDR